MRKITHETVQAFLSHAPFSKDNTEVITCDATECIPSGTGLDHNYNHATLLLHENEIAYIKTHTKTGKRTIKITSANWKTNTTKERLNGIPGVHIVQKQGNWYLNGTLWSGEWTTIS